MLKFLDSQNMKEYAKFYDKHAIENPTDLVIGSGDYDVIGELMLSAIKMVGLKSDSTLLDFGCGTGRLALKAIPFLSNGHYIGLEISKPILERAKNRVKNHAFDKKSHKSAVVNWLLQKDSNLIGLKSDSIDYISAFSVFTHLEHEDIYCYLKSFHRIAKDHCKLVASFLLMEENHTARTVFLESAKLNFKERHKQVLNIATTKSFIDEIAVLAGWNIKEWIRHDEPKFSSPNNPDMGLGQAVAIFERSHA